MPVPAALLCPDHPQELSGGPPAGFTLTESQGDTLLTLSKDYRGETVTVDVLVNDQVGAGGGGVVLKVAAGEADTRLCPPAAALAHACAPSARVPRSR